MTEKIRTLAKPAEHAVEIRKSRFVAHAGPVTDAAAAEAFLAFVADASANHHCWAWKLGQQYRFSDDGEPGGSAGKPILMAIEGQHLDRVMVVVTRWFGGIKLGVGGLMRAYGGSAAECLRQAVLVDILDLAPVRFKLDYAEMALFKARTRDWDLHSIDEVFGPSQVDMTLKVERDRLDELQQLLADISRGQTHLHRL